MKPPLRTAQPDAQAISSAIKILMAQIAAMIQVGRLLRAWHARGEERWNLASRAGGWATPQAREMTGKKTIRS